MLKLLFVVSFVSESFGAVFMGKVTEHPDHPGKCYLPETDKAYDVGESWHLPDCLLASCITDNHDELFVQYAGCGTASAEPPCYLERDNTLPYPDCCDRLACPTETDEGVAERQGVPPPGVLHPGEDNRNLYPAPGYGNNIPDNSNQYVPVSNRLDGGGPPLAAGPVDNPPQQNPYTPQMDNVPPPQQDHYPQ